MKRISKYGEVHIGQSFGRWIVISGPIRPDGSTWGRTRYLCRCSCGVEKEVVATTLLRGKSLSCGCRKSEVTREMMHKKRKLIPLNTQFGRWTVIHVDVSPYSKAIYTCQCLCGTERIVRANHLLMGRSKSCGCINEKRIIEGNKRRSLGLSKEQHNKYMRTYMGKWNTKRRNHIFDMLGGRCQGCNIEDRRILTIDHIHGGGTRHRRTQGGYRVMRDVLQSPEKYRVLCWNCQHLARLGQLRNIT